MERFFLSITLVNQQVKAKFMHEVKVYDGSGNLKEVISVKKLNIRSKQQLESPSLFMKNKKTGKPAEKPSGESEKTQTQ